MLTVKLAAELADRQIAVNAVCPGCHRYGRPRRTTHTRGRRRHRLGCHPARPRTHRQIFPRHPRNPLVNQETPSKHTTAHQARGDRQRRSSGAIMSILLADNDWCPVAIDECWDWAAPASQSARAISSSRPPAPGSTRACAPRHCLNAIPGSLPSMQISHDWRKAGGIGGRLTMKRWYFHSGAPMRIRLRATDHEVLHPIHRGQSFIAEGRQYVAWVDVPVGHFRARRLQTFIGATQASVLVSPCLVQHSATPRLVGTQAPALRWRQLQRDHCHRR